MAFKSNRPADTSTPKGPFKSQPAAAASADKKPASKPEYLLKVKDGDKFVRIGGMWSDGKGGFKITFDAGIEISSTESERFKCNAWVNDYEEKFGSSLKK